MNFKNCVLLTMILFSQQLSAQQLFYSDIVYGGVAGIGFSGGGCSGNVYGNLLIPSNSTIKKAFLIVATDSTPPPITVMLNNQNYTFTDSNIITNGFISFQNFGVTRSNSSLRIIEITSEIDPSISEYSLYLPPQPYAIPNQTFYTQFYLYIVYENTTLPKIYCSLFLNDKNVSSYSTYNLNDINPIDNNDVVGLAIVTSQLCDTIQDGSYIIINNNEIGLIGGEDANSFCFCTGPHANFSHHNSTLFGLDDDTPDSLMAASDVLADIKSYTNQNDTSIELIFDYQSNFSPLSNPICAVMLSYSTPCDTFSMSISTDTTICLGTNVQLWANGGSDYSWYCTFDTIDNNTISNPIVSPTQTATYICSITNDSGCVKTDHVKIWVTPTPLVPILSSSPTLCSDSSGVITVQQVDNTYQYSLESGAFQNEGTFENLATGTYTVITKNEHGCTSQPSTITIEEINPTQALFTATPTQGEIPLTVQFNNQSTDATDYTWYIADDTLSETSPSYVFNEIGEFTASLIAYDTYPWCSDTTEVLKIITEYPFNIIIPSTYFSYTDSYQIYTSRVSQLDYTLFNSIGQQVYHRHFVPETGYSPLWERKDVVRGVYLYTVKVTGEDGEVREIVGRVMVM